jgi:beta-galactosidase
MRMFLTLGVIVTALLPRFSLADTRPQNGARDILSLDANWHFLRSDATDGNSTNIDGKMWKTIDLPHSYNADDGLDANTYRGPAWYRRTVTLPKTAANKRTYIEFDGAALATDVWINGTNVGRHEGGYARFRFDITPHIKAGANVVAVRVDNSKLPHVAPLSGDFTVFGGLYRSVRLVTTRDVHFDMLDYGSSGVAFKAMDVTAKSAALNWTARLANDRKQAAKVKLVVRLRDAKQKAVATVSKAVTLPPQAVTPVSLDTVLDAPHLWQGVDDPYLYTSEVELVAEAAKPAPLDRVSFNVGIRDIRLDPDKGLLLNGKVYDVHGVNLHHTVRPGKGPAVTDAEIDEDFALFDDIGNTGMRFAHYQHAQHEYDLADRKGYLIWTEIPLVNAVNASEAFQANIQQQLRELIRQNINHPSVFVWGIGNEVLKVDEDSARTLAALQKIAKEEDPTRPTAYANCCSEIDGPQSSHSDAIASNIYFGWYNGEFADFGPWMDANRAKRPTTPQAISEYGAGASVKQQEDPPQKPQHDGPWHPEQYQTLYHESAWKQLEARPWLWANYIWVGFDFASAGRKEGDSIGINDKGLITYDRKVKKDAYFWYQANWTTKPMVYITSRRHTLRKTAEVEVKVYSNQQTVSLRMNGQDLGPQLVVDRVARWKVKLVPGNNRIEATTDALADTVEWTFQP